jgi:hypothetical protein
MPLTYDSMHEFAGVTNLMAQRVQPEKAYFKDDGSIPNRGTNGWRAAWISA